MTDTINNGIPFVPESTIDPAAGLNLSLKVIDALIQVAVLSRQNDPPGTPSEGDRYIVGTTPSGVWVGSADKLAHYLDGGWSYYDARIVLNLTDDTIWVRHESGWGARGNSQIAVLGNQNDPPVSHSSGDTYIVGSSPTGDWVGHAGSLAFSFDGEWRYSSARYVINLADGQMWIRNASGWASIATTLNTLSVPVYANNAAAIAGGLVAGDRYRTGGDPDTLCIVH